MNYFMRRIISLALLGLLVYLPIELGLNYIIGFVVGFISANVVFFSNNPMLVMGITRLTGRRSYIRDQFDEDVKNEKENKIRYKG